MTSTFCWPIFVSLCPASFCTPRPYFPVTPGISWLSTLHSSPLLWKKHLFGVLVLESLVVLQRTVKLQLHLHYLSGDRLGFLWYWMTCLGKEPRSFCHFWDWIQVLHFGLLSSMKATPFLLRDSCPQYIYIPIHFTLLIPKMLMFTLAISRLTTSNLPWSWT